MNLFQVIVSCILLLSTNVFSRPPNVYTDFNLEDIKYLSEQNVDNLNKRADDTPIVTTEEVCIRIAQSFIKILLDPDVNLTFEQLLMIPKLNENKLDISQSLEDCSEEYYKWLRSFEPLVDTITDDQSNKIRDKLNLLHKEMFEESREKE